MLVLKTGNLKLRNLGNFSRLPQLLTPTILTTGHLYVNQFSEGWDQSTWSQQSTVCSHVAHRARFFGSCHHCFLRIFQEKTILCGTNKYTIPFRALIIEPISHQHSYFRAQPGPNKSESLQIDHGHQYILKSFQVGNQSLRFSTSRSPLKVPRLYCFLHP